MGFERLPQELIEEIFDHLQRCKGALKVCSLVCKAWVDPAYRRLFHDTRLNWDQFCTAFDRRYLPRKPESIAAPFIRRLDIGGSTRARQWNETFSSLSGLHSISSLSVDDLRWDKIYPEIRWRIVDRFGTITRLHLHRVVTTSFSKFARLICAFRCLENLILGKTFWHKSNKASPLLRLPRRLHALELDSRVLAEILEWLGSFGQDLPLRNVCFLDLYPYHSPVVNKFLRVLGPSLESFRVHLDGLYCPIRLDHNTHLRFLHLDVQRGLANETGLAPLLSGVVSERVEHMSLSLNHIPGGDDDYVYYACVPMEWREVDAILAGRRFLNLKSVKVCHGRLYDLCINIDRRLEWLLPQLPLTRKRGILRSVLCVCEEKRCYPFI